MRRSTRASAAAPAAETKPATAPDLSPAVRKLVAEHNLDASKISGTGKGGRIIKEDVLNYLESQESAPAAAAPAAPAAKPAASVPSSACR